MEIIYSFPVPEFSNSTYDALLRLFAGARLMPELE